MDCYKVDNDKLKLIFNPLELSIKDVRRALCARLDVIELLPSWVNSQGHITAKGLLAERTNYGFYNHQQDRLIRIKDPYFRIPEGCTVYQVGYRSDELYLLVNNHLIRIYNVKNSYPPKEGFIHRQDRLKARRVEEENKREQEREDLAKKQNEELKKKKLERLLASISD